MPEAIRGFPELGKRHPLYRLVIAQAYRAGSRLLTDDRVLFGVHRKFVVDAGV